MKKNQLKSLTQALSVTAILLLSACSSNTNGSAGTQEYFVLGTSQAAKLSSISGQPNISISRVRLPAYLNQRTLVKRGKDGKIHTLNQQFWAEKLGQSMPQSLAKELAVQLGKPVEVHPLPPGISVDTTVEVDVTEFLGTDSQLVLQASYRLIKPKKLDSHNFSTTVTLPDTSTITLVDGYRQAVEQLSNDIAKHL
ncbi:MAG: membrane integrity-associated transporter subunit PqiC [Gammaproteobacteria bacterium]|nr:membrane integrity-associated transporter subunit PqiC [Gammaproteobacteria bacterium]